MSGRLLIFAPACPQGGCASDTSLSASLHAGWYVQSLIQPTGRVGSAGMAENLELPRRAD